MRELTPSTIAAPFAKYSHGMVVPEGFRLVFTSGQLGLSKDGITPEDAGGQAAVCFANIDAILAESDLPGTDWVAYMPHNPCNR